MVLNLLLKRSFMGIMGFIKPESTSKTVEQTSSIVLKNDFKHAYICGQTGSGKTASGMIPLLKSRIEEGHSAIIFDYKNVEHRNVKVLAKKAGRLSDVIQLGVPWGISCNLIQYMNESQLSKFVVSLMDLESSNSYWSTSSVNIVLAIFKSIKAYLNIIETASEINNKKSYLNTVVKFRLPTDLTFTVIADICKSSQSIVLFLNKLQKLANRFEINTVSKIEDFSKRHETDEVKEKFVELMSSVLFFKNIVATELKSLEVFNQALESSPSSTYATIILSMATTFSSISSNKKFNDANGVDIAKELNEGKILIINSQELSNAILSSFTNSLLQRLSQRVQDKTIQAVSVFIDEAQKILNSDMDLHTDVLRQSKVEIILAFQNYNLMINALDASKFKALLLNLSTSFHFKNPGIVADLETSELKTFEYYKDGGDKIYTAQPLFLDESEIFEIELEYYHINRVYDQLNIDEKYQDQVITFNPYLYQRNMIELKDRSGKSTVIRLRDKKREIETSNVIANLITSYKAAVVRKTREAKRKSQPTLSDLVGDRLSEVNEFMGTEE